MNASGRTRPSKNREAGRADTEALAGMATRDRSRAVPVVRLPYRPRPLQRDLHARMRRFNVLVCHRRFGKQDVIAWHRHPIGGRDARALSLAAIPATDHDRLWLAIERMVAGQSCVTIEFLERPFWSETTKDLDAAFFVDSGLSYDGWNRDPARRVAIEGGAPWSAGSIKSLNADMHSPFLPGDVGKVFRVGAPGVAWPPVGLEVTEYTSADRVSVRLLNAVPQVLQQHPTPHWARAATVVSGLDHLEGEVVEILADGAAHPARTVEGGSVVLAHPAVVIHAGLGYESRLETLDLEAGGIDGTAIGKSKRIHRVTVRLFASLGCAVGFGESHMDEIAFRGSSDAMDQPPPLFSGDRSIVFPKGWDNAARVMVVQSQPLPLTVSAIAPHITTNG